MKYISPQDLAEILLDQSQIVGKDYLIIDVRGDDYPFGNILQARNIPSHEFIDKIQDYHNELKDVKLIIFHCALSQVRGPKCANKYNDIKSSSQQVNILRGGFQHFGQLYSHNSKLVENYNQEYWNDPY